MGLLSPPSTFNFPMSGGDGQSLQRHRSTSTPNVHMVSTVDLATISGMEVSGHTAHLSKNVLVFELLMLTLLRCSFFLGGNEIQHNRYSILQSTVFMLCLLVLF